MASVIRVAETPLTFNTVIGTVNVQPGTEYEIDDETNMLISVRKVIAGVLHMVTYLWHEVDATLDVTATGLTATGVADGLKPPINWNFGEQGTGDVYTEGDLTQAHTYAAAGTYTVKATDRVMAVEDTVTVS